MIPFNKPPYTGNEDQYVMSAMRSDKMSGDGEFTIKCHKWFEENLGCKKVLLTPSCTQALEMAALLLNVQEGDEVIMPSYTFVSTANAFVLRGAKIVFVDIRPDTMNINEELIEAAITEKTIAIVVVHYAGIPCEMDKIMDISKRKSIYVVEDAAQGMMSKYKGRALGTIGHLAAFSFHETKNYTSGGEGGLLIINDVKFVGRAEIIREKGTNRSQFFRGMIDKYTWVDIGSSYLPGELQAAYLYGQLESSEIINSARLSIWNSYYEGLKDLAPHLIELPIIPDMCIGNAHMFYIKVLNLKVREEILDILKRDNISAVFHYIPLHSSPAGRQLGFFHGEDKYTTQESERLMRLPIWFGMTDIEIHCVIESVRKAIINCSR
ncbi:dTDP-4-amino-4,6-dideoxygalactose transaminase [Pseudomonas lundensis]|uniref:dTDP-4-amino-4,6-dideoxygalactose transaminase n=1 Tax=Pseudomonas lundensis TaxID=86185 RepID=UPI001473C74B|nr:dTDP-4-amino-4,6-dideoxygalactose transaminase [Pseudomonas lundensis]NNA23506.1 dTDP-4-amino-4,6-dideoxygalactose transaminase [Pseudomonas lundensis]